MERILKEFKSHIKNNPYSDHYEEISLITYVANLTQCEIITNEIEAASNILHCALTRLYEDHYITIQNVLDGEEQYLILTEKSNGSSFKIFIRDIWLFRIILINSLKHSDIVNNAVNNSHHNLLTSIIDHILNNIDIVKLLSLHLLKTLLLVVTKRKDTLSPNLNRLILNRMNKVALSPFTVFRQYAREISKQVISFATEEETVFLDVTLLPIRGVDMYDIVKCYSKTFIRKNLQIIIKKVLSMFLKNVESKDGGALYECLLFYSFDEWKKHVWPPFLDSLKYIDYEGEFFQSLLKYWITMNVNAYKNEFYNFLREESIDWKLKGYILLESKRKGCIFDDDLIKRDILITFNDLETRDLALKLATTYHKKSLWPTTYEIDVVLSYLYSNTNVSLEEEESRSLRHFFSQIFLHAHNELKKSEENVPRYASILEIIYKYCRCSLKTDFYEVGAEIAFILWSITAGSHKELVLSYRLDKRDFYSKGENLFYILLKEKNMWWFASATFQQELTNCFHVTNGSSNYLTKLFTKYLDISTFVNTIDLKKIAKESSLQAGLDTEKRIKNYSEIVFRSECYSKENLGLLDELNDFIVNLNISRENRFSDDIVFKTILYLEIITVAVRHNRYDIEKLHNLVEKSLSLVENIIINNNCGNVNYRTTKILEAFINEVMLCMIENANVLWNNVDRDKVVKHLTMIIQRSNMKRPLSLSVEVLKRFGSKMNESDTDKNYKIQFLDETLKSLHQTATKSDLKIRRNPESRLVIHAMCSSDSNPNKPILKWALTYLVEVISDPSTTDSAIASALHSIEILISDSNLQSPTLPFISDIIVQCVELFARSSWVIRNADLQLTRAIIDRFYGVCLDICNRPKCIEDLLILFPCLSSYFRKVLSSDNLDERAILVFQFFLESQIKEHLWQPEISMGHFHQLFMNILQTYPNHYGKMAARSYSAICITKEIPKDICSIIRFLKVNFRCISKNITTNFAFLIQQLYEKYKNSFQHCVNKEGIKVINVAIMDLLKYLRRYNTEFFDFILFKVESQTEILNKCKNCDNIDFRKRLWLHNNIPFIFANAKPKEISGILNKVLSKDILSCIQIKILMVLISKFENNEFSSDVSNHILSILFGKSFSLDDNDNYLLNCYFKTILVFYRRNDSLSFKNESLQFKITSNIYKLMIFVLYFSEHPQQLNDKQLFYELVETKYMNLVPYTEELKNDVISTLPYLQKEVPKQFRLKIFKLIFYCSLFYSTHFEAYKCITVITNKSYSSILSALTDFFSVQNLTLRLRDKTLVVNFFSDVIKYLPEHFQQVETDGYYSEESDILVSKLFLGRLINSEIRKMQFL